MDSIITYISLVSYNLMYVYRNVCKTAFLLLLWCICFNCGGKMSQIAEFLLYYDVTTVTCILKVIDLPRLDFFACITRQSQFTRLVKYIKYLTTWAPTVQAHDSVFSAVQTRLSKTYTM